MTTQVYVVLQEVEDWGFDGENSFCELSWVPIKVFAREEDAKEYCAPYHSSFKYQPFPLE